MIKGKEELQSLRPYSAGKPIEEVKREYGLSHVVKLASNENPYGCSEKAKQAISEAINLCNLYPDGYAYELRRKLCDKLDIPMNEIVFGTGSDGLIELICKTFLKPGDEAVVPTPSFPLYETNVLAQSAKPVMVELDENHKMNLPKMIEAITDRTKLVWLCNPNNPTGSMIDKKAQQQFMNGIPDDVLLVIDEAYYEYAKANPEYPDSLAMAKERKNVIILRTFSKIYGLAGLRVGYGIAHSSIISEMEKVRAPFNVGSIAQAAAMASLDDDNFVTMTNRLNQENKQYLYTEFDRMGLTYIPTSTNFIMTNVRGSGKEVFEKLLKIGYIVKGGHVLGMDDYIRVTIGTKEECVGFVKALKEVLEEA